MKKYVVTSGSMRAKVKAENRTLAAMDAIRKSNPKALGLLIGVRKVGDDELEETYMLTTKILESMGYTVEGKT